MKPITDIGQMKQSKFLKKDDVGDGILVTIKELSEENVAMEDQPPEVKYILSFQENALPDGSDMKPIVLNWTNIQLCAVATGSKNPQEWPGKKIVLYTDPNVSFGGKLIGGIRIRAARTKQAEAPAPKAEPFEDDIPF